MADETNSRALRVLRRFLPEDMAANSDDAALVEVDIDCLDIDSLGKLEMVMELEKEFGLMLNEAEIAACKRIGDLVALVARTSGQPG